MMKAAVALALVAFFVAGVKVARSFDDESAMGASKLDDAAAALPAPATPAFTVGRPRLLDEDEQAARYAPVRRLATARSAPSAAAAPVAPLSPRTEEGTTNIVLVLDERRTRDGLWIHVRLPVLPNGRTGWVRRGTLGGYRFVHTRLVVDRGRLTATLLENGRPVFRAPVGIGEAVAPTPAGDFYVRLRLTSFDDPFYGPVAFGLNARSAVLTDWPGGGYIGIHGTHAPELIPGRISHGCVRMRNQDIRRLDRLMPVGTPVTIR